MKTLYNLYDIAVALKVSLDDAKDVLKSHDYIVDNVREYKLDDNQLNILIDHFSTAYIEQFNSVYDFKLVNDYIVKDVDTWSSFINYNCSELVKLDSEREDKREFDELTNVGHELTEEKDQNANNYQFEFNYYSKDVELDAFSEAVSRFIDESRLIDYHELYKIAFVDYNSVKDQVKTHLYKKAKYKGLYRTYNENWNRLVDHKTLIKKIICFRWHNMNSGSEDEDGDNFDQKLVASIW